ncbi:MAG: hypothetical protein ABF297_15990 [Thiogranum sp.]
MSHSSPSALGHKVNRRQARQGELRSKRESPGGEGALGHKVNRRQAREGALGHAEFITWLFFSVRTVHPAMVH